MELSHFLATMEFSSASLKAKLDICQIIEDSKRAVDSPSKFTVGLKKVLINFATTYKLEKKMKTRHLKLYEEFIGVKS